MADDKLDKDNGTHLRWQAVDEETGDVIAKPLPRQQLSRTASASSATSARPIRRGSIDPAVTLPIHYRSV